MVLPKLDTVSVVFNGAGWLPAAQVGPGPSFGDVDDASDIYKRIATYVGAIAAVLAPSGLNKCSEQTVLSAPDWIG